MTAAAFRRFDRLQDEMTRAMMPRVSAADPAATTVVPAQARVRWTLGRRYETKGAFTLGEAVAHA